MTVRPALGGTGPGRTSTSPASPRHRDFPLTGLIRPHLGNRHRLQAGTDGQMATRCSRVVRRSHPRPRTKCGSRLAVGSRPPGRVTGLAEINSNPRGGQRPLLSRAWTGQTAICFLCRWHPNGRHPGPALAALHNSRRWRKNQVVNSRTNRSMTMRSSGGASRRPRSAWKISLKAVSSCGLLKFDTV